MASERDQFHYHLKDVPRWGGFSTESAGAHEGFWMQTRGFVTSDQNEFHHYVHQIFSSFVGDRFSAEQVNFLVVVLHEDASADVHVEDVIFSIRMMSKRDMAQGSSVTAKDIADIDQIRFDNIQIDKTDSIVFCFRCGWKFGLFFDFLPPDSDAELDLEEMQMDLGRWYKRLRFDELYSILENETLFTELLEDGWFPFIALVGGDYETLAAIYVDPKKGALLSDFVEKFNRKRIEAITSYWWRVPLLKEKEELLKAGLEAYLKGPPAGYINCIKNLYSEIEGILRMSYVKKFGKDPTFEDLKKHAEEMAGDKFTLKEPFSFPRQFYQYLDKVLLKSFSLLKEDVELSRHSSSHGVAPPNLYTREKALQAILTIDHMRYFIS